LLKQGATEYGLRYIICCAPEAWKGRAWEQLLRQGATEDGLRYIIYNAPGAWAKKAKKLLENK
jgi:hypothetical protein